MDLNEVKDELFLLGKAYRILMNLVREDGANQSELENASHNPMGGLGYAYNLAIKLHRLTPKVEKKIAVLLEQIEPDTINFKQSPSLEMQGEFLRGYSLSGYYGTAIPNILKYRKEAGLTQSQLAEKIGVLQKDISRWENGIVEPSAQYLKQLAVALNCKVDDILGGVRSALLSDRQ